jgi:hypothetical protein
MGSGEGRLLKDTVHLINCSFHVIYDPNYVNIHFVLS